MAEFFLRKQIRAVSVHSKSSIRRNEALDQLNLGAIDIIFSVDLFNEGVDLPNNDRKAEIFAACKEIEASL